MKVGEEHLPVLQQYLLFLLEQQQPNLFQSVGQPMSGAQTGETDVSWLQTPEQKQSCPPLDAITSASAMQRHYQTSSAIKFLE